VTTATHSTDPATASVAPARTTAKARPPKVDLSLKILHEVFGLEHLHYGLWDGEPLTLDGLKAAQQRYQDYLHSWIPGDVRRVLDVGAGVGTGALALKRRGCHVEGLSPDPYQRERFIALTGLPFHLARFQEHRLTAAFDLVLMSESAQYIPVAALFARARPLVPRGHLLVADYFRRPNLTRHLNKSGHQLDAFLAAAAASGFELVRREDVTSRVTPTLDLARLWVERHADPALRIGYEALARRHRIVFWLARALIERLLAKLQSQRHVLDGAEFARTKSYELMLFRVR